MLGEVIYVFNDDPLGPPPELLRVFCEDIEPDAGIDGDWDVVAAFNVRRCRRSRALADCSSLVSL
jgi:serine/threonine-protein phosphatase 4 regulatory subunit 1